MKDLRPSVVMMVRPVRFGYNVETAVTNTFQKNTGLDPEKVQKTALAEFDALVSKLRSEGVEVHVFEDANMPHTPDSIFPNNWISFHESGHMVLYPMLAENRRLERKEDIVNQIKELYASQSIHDLTVNEATGRFLEGTGSIVFDYINDVAYAAVSPRTDKELVNEICRVLGFRPVFFTSLDKKGTPVYHTNVIMCVGEKFAVICAESITEEGERKAVLNELLSGGKTVVEITQAQVEQFAGNMYELINSKGDHLLLMSEQAHRSLTEEQKKTLEGFCRIISSPLDTIELHGGGSARCMIADIRLPKKSM
jgi:hypothetical protein